MRIFFGRALNSPSYSRQHGTWPMSAMCTILGAILFVPLLYGQRPPSANVSEQRLEWKRVEVRIVARGPSVTSSIGNMDSYLALVSAPGHGHSVTAARLVDYYPSFQDGLSNARMTAGHTLRLRLSYASYCRVAAKDFAVQQAFDEDAIAKLRSANHEQSLPCFLVRQ